MTTKAFREYLKSLGYTSPPCAMTQERDAFNAGFQAGYEAAEKLFIWGDDSGFDDTDGGEQ